MERNKIHYNFEVIIAVVKAATGDTIISNEALASLTLFAAASKPEEMETVKNLIVSILTGNQ